MSRRRPDRRVPVSLAGSSRSMVLEPRPVCLYRRQGQAADIPNRDSADYRIDEANMFLLNRYQGYDYLRLGSRADMGVSAVANDALVGDVTGFVGASYRLSGKPSSGLTVNDMTICRTLSRALASIPTCSNQPVGRLASSDFELNDPGLRSRVRKLGYTVEHVQMAKPYFQSGFRPRGNEAVAELRSAWRMRAPAPRSGICQTAKQGGTARQPPEWTGGIQNCLTISLDYDRDMQSDRDISSTDQFMLTVNFKYSAKLPRMICSRETKTNSRHHSSGISLAKKVTSSAA